MTKNMGGGRGLFISRLFWIVYLCSVKRKTAARSILSARPKCTNRIKLRAASACRHFLRGDLLLRL